MSKYIIYIQNIKLDTYSHKFYYNSKAPIPMNTSTKDREMKLKNPDALNEGM
jgi:hypothetical protein